MRFRFGYLSALSLTIAMTVAIRPASAQVVYEGFQLTFPDYDTGTGLSGAWEQGGFNVFAAGYTTSEISLSFRGLETSGGQIAGAAFTRINGSIRNLAQSLGADNTTVYVSFLLRPLGTLNDGVFNGFFGVTLAGGPANELFVGKPGGGAVDPSGRSETDAAQVDADHRFRANTRLALLPPNPSAFTSTAASGRSTERS